MEMLYTLPPNNFCGMEDSKYENSKLVVFPVPFDSTAFYRPGSRNGPAAIIEASRNMEVYDIELQADPSRMGIHTLEYLEPCRGDVEETIRRVEDVEKQLLVDSKIPVILGGEHSVTAGALEAFDKGVDVLQIDAHADLRNEFEGSKYGHACVMRRVREKHNIVQVGIRSMSEEESEYVRKHDLNIHYGRKFNVDDVVSDLGKDIYISFDLDALDPSIMPAVGTPEPGGLLWDETLRLLKEVCEKKTVVGFDVVELCPIPGQIGSDFFASLLTYKIMGYIGKKRGWL
ncbi:MAG: agmatinase [Candidatus Micrarchaeota archaeon]